MSSASSEDLNEVFARKEEKEEIGQLEHKKPCRLHQLYLDYEEGFEYIHQN